MEKIKTETRRQSKMETEKSIKTIDMLPTDERDELLKQLAIESSKENKTMIITDNKDKMRDLSNNHDFYTTEGAEGQYYEMVDKGMTIEQIWKKIVIKDKILETFDNKINMKASYNEYKDKIKNKTYKVVCSKITKRHINLSDKLWIDSNKEFRGIMKLDTKSLNEQNMWLDELMILTDPEFYIDGFRMKDEELINYLTVLYLFEPLTCEFHKERSTFTPKIDEILESGLFEKTITINMLDKIN